MLLHQISAPAPLCFMGHLGSGGVMGPLGFRVGASASYSYFRVSWKITTFVIREKFSQKTASIVNYILWIFTENNTLHIFGAVVGLWPVQCFVTRFHTRTIPMLMLHKLISNILWFRSAIPKVLTLTLTSSLTLSLILTVTTLRYINLHLLTYLLTYSRILAMADRPHTTRDTVPVPNCRT